MKNNILEFIFKLADFLIKSGNNLQKGNIELSKAVFDSNGRFLLYYAINTKMLANHDFLKVMFNKLRLDSDFLKFGNKKSYDLTSCYRWINIFFSP